MLAGGAGWDRELDAAVAAVPAGLRLLRPGYLPLADLPGLLGAAAVVAYPSLGEGFGLPVLEAMACGAAVLTTRRLALPEVGGDAVAYTEPDDASIADALGWLLTDPELREPAGPGRPGPGRGGSAGRPAPRRTWPATSGRCAAAGRRAGDDRHRRRPARPPTVQTVAVVAVTFSPGNSLAGFLDSLAARHRRGPSRCCWPTTARWTARRRPPPSGAGVTLLSTGGNIGYGRAANAGVAATSADWVVVANPDVVWEPGSLDELLAAAERWPRAGALGPLIREPDGQVYPSARALPTLGRGIGHAVFGWWWPGNPWSVRYRRENEDPRERTAGWLSGSCLLLRRQAFDSVGGFDPAYFMYFEDVDLGERLADAGWLNVYVPSAVVTHTGSHADLPARRGDDLGAPPQRLAVLQPALPGTALAAAAAGGPARAGGARTAVAAAGRRQRRRPAAPQAGRGSDQRRQHGQRDSATG